jgi:hypothetical protein
MVDGGPASERAAVSRQGCPDCPRDSFKKRPVDTLLQTSVDAGVRAFRRTMHFEVANVSLYEAERRQRQREES